MLMKYYLCVIKQMTEQFLHFEKDIKFSTILLFIRRKHKAYYFSNLHPRLRT